MKALVLSSSLVSAVLILARTQVFSGISASQLILCRISPSAVLLQRKYNILHFSVHDVSNIHSYHIMRTQTGKKTSSILAEPIRSIPPDSCICPMATVNTVVGNNEINITIFINITCKSCRR